MKLDPVILEILYTRIKNGGRNPLTNMPMTISDIKIKEYKDEIQKMLTLE